MASDALQPTNGRLRAGRARHVRGRATSRRSHRTAVARHRVEPGSARLLFAHGFGCSAADQRSALPDDVQPTTGRLYRAGRARHVRGRATSRRSHHTAVARHRVEPGSARLLFAHDFGCSAADQRSALPGRIFSRPTVGSTCQPFNQRLHAAPASAPGAALAHDSPIRACNRPSVSAPWCARPHACSVVPSRSKRCRVRWW